MALLAIGAGLALTLLLAWLPLHNAGHLVRAPASTASTSSRAARTVPTGPVVEATEVTATPSRGEPTDAVPGGTASPATQAQATQVPALSESPTPTTISPTQASANIEITCADAENNVYGEVCVHTTPGAAITVTVTYCNGLQAHNTDLQGTRYADSNGDYTWNWVPETTCPGTAVAHVTAGGSGGSSDASGTFTVTP